MLLKKTRVFLLSGLIVVSLVLSLQTILADPPSGTPPSISYGGVVNNGDGTYTFTYILTSGDPVILKWQLKSPCFRQGSSQYISAIAWDVDNPTFTPDWNLNPGQKYIEFKHESKQPFTDGLVRTYEITFSTGYYGGITVGSIGYEIHWPPPGSARVEGTITGPLCPPEFLIPESQLGTIGSLLALLSAVGLVAFKKGLIVFTKA